LEQWDVSVTTNHLTLVQIGIMIQIHAFLPLQNSGNHKNFASNFVNND